MDKDVFRITDLAGRRTFIGGSDARIIMGNDETALSISGRRNGARSSHTTYPATSSSSLGS